MLRRVISVILVIIALSIIVGCATTTGSNVKRVDKNIIEMENTFQSMKEKFIENGAIAAIGQGVSARRDLARERKR